MSIQIKTITAFLLVAILISGCATKPLSKAIYPRAVYPFDRYPMFTESDGISGAAIPFTLGIDVYADPGKPVSEKSPPPLNVLDAGILPLRLLILNNTGSEILLDPEQIEGIAGATLYKSYTAQEAVNLVIQSKQFQEAIKGSSVGPVLRSILGGEVIFEAAKSGIGAAASGDITGAPTGAARGAAGVGFERAQGYEKGLIELIQQEYTDRAFRRSTLYPGFLADGLLFLPSQTGITALQIPVYDQTHKKTILLKMSLPEKK